VSQSSLSLFHNGSSVYRKTTVSELDKYPESGTKMMDSESESKDITIDKYNGCELQAKLQSLMVNINDKTKTKISNQIPPKSNLFSNTNNLNSYSNKKIKLQYNNDLYYRNENVETESSLSKIHLTHINLPDKVELPIINTRVKSYTFRTLIDSGASHTFMSKHMADLCGIKYIARSPTSVTLADGSEVNQELFISERFSVEIAKLKYNVNAIVMPTLNDVELILGIPWFKTANPEINWDIGRMHLTIDSHQAQVWFLRDNTKADHCLSFIHWSNFTKNDQLIVVRQPCLSHIEVKNSPEIEALLKEFRDAFPDELPGLPPHREVTHSIDTGDAKPISQRSYQMSPKELEALKAHIDELLRLGFIRPSSSPWSSPVLFVKKKDGSLRLCVDYRALNAVTRRDTNPVPRVGELLDILGSASIFSKLDLLSGYHQVRMSEESITKTAFSTRYGTFEYLVVPFGLSNAPPTFMRAMHNIFHDLLDKILILYLDDILIFSNSEEDHLKHLEQVFMRLRAHKLYAKLSKCEFLMKEISFLGHVLSAGSVAMDPEKISAIKDWKTPNCSSDVRSFIGLAGYYHRFVKDFAEIAAPLYKTMNLDEKKFTWSEVEELSFRKLIDAISSAPVLRTANFDLPFLVTCDASIHAVGGVLSQQFSDGEHPIAFISHKLSPAESNYPVHELELLAIVTCLKKWRCYLEGSPFTVRTDHASLALIRKQKTMSRRMFRWISLLEEFGFDFKIEYQPGKENVVADALSRMQLNNINISATTWPEEFIKYLDPIDRNSLDDKVKNMLSKNEHNLRIVDEVIQFKNQYNLWVDYIPFVHRADLVFKHHHSLCHVGPDKIIESLERRCWWPSLKNDVRSWLKNCITCHRENAIPSGNRTIYPLPIVPLFSRWNIDFVGPLTVSSRGNNCVIVAVEFVSKWVIVKALPNQLAENVVDFLYSEIVTMFGVPEEIISDQGTNFMSRCVAEFNRRLLINHKRTTAYHPRSNGAVERVNKNVVSLIRKCLMSSQGEWEQYISKVVFTCRVVKHASTGFSPFEVLFGREPRLPGDSVNPQMSDFPEPIDVARLAQIRSKVMENIQRSQAYNKDYVERKFSTPEKEINVGDIVLVKIQCRSKFEPKWSLPHRVVECTGKGTFKLEDSRGNLVGPLINRDNLSKVDLLDDFWSS